MKLILVVKHNIKSMISTKFLVNLLDKFRSLKSGRTSSERLTYAQFTSCVQGIIMLNINYFACKVIVKDKSSHLCYDFVFSKISAILIIINLYFLHAFKSL